MKSLAIDMEGFGALGFRQRCPLARPQVLCPHSRSPASSVMGLTCPRRCLSFFILCVVYSVLLMGYLVLSIGLAYFVLAYFTCKYHSSCTRWTSPQARDRRSVVHHMLSRHLGSDIVPGRRVGGTGSAWLVRSIDYRLPECALI